MVFKRISLKNFKCFKESDIELAKITLLTGANSSGKSSFLYSLLAILQTENFPFYLSPNGNYVNLGGFNEIVFNHKAGRKIEISGSIENSSEYEKQQLDFKTIWAKNPKNDLPQLDGLQGETEEFKIELIHKDRYFLNLKIQNENYDISGLHKWFAEIKNIKTKKTILDESLIDIQNAEFKDLDEFFKKFSLWSIPLALTFLDTLFNIPSRFDNTFNYIGSFRHSPERTYYQKAKSRFKVDVSGEGYIDQILEWEETGNPKFEMLNSFMRELQLFSQIKSKKINGGRFEFNVKTYQEGISASLADVGFGISQFLPIIVADLQLSDNSILAVSQPEMHLHPKVQAALGNYFVKQASKNDKQYIIETHSEYLLNRLRLAIVKEEINPQDIFLYYFENSLEGTKTYKIELTRDGQIQNAPKGFFDTYMIDTMEIAMNA